MRVNVYPEALQLSAERVGKSTRRCVSRERRDPVVVGSSAPRVLPSARPFLVPLVKERRALVKRRA